MKIYTGIYGLGKRGSPARIESIFCDNCENCSVYKKGKCFNVTIPFGKSCKFGKIETLQIGTDRSNKYHTERQKAKNDPTYSKLEYPNDYIALINDTVMLTVPHVYIHDDRDTGKLEISDPMLFSNYPYYMKVEDFTIDFLARLLSFKPQAFMGGVITNYQDKIVPEFLLQLSKLFPEKYNLFVTEYPEYKKEFNYIGKKAYIATCNKDVVYHWDYPKAEYHFERDYLVGKCGAGLGSPFGAKEYEIRVKVTDDLIVKITDNNQVLPDTKFVE